MMADLMLRLRLCWAILQGKPVMYRCRIKAGTVMAERGGYYVGNLFEGKSAEHTIGIHCAVGSHLGG